MAGPASPCITPYWRWDPSGDQLKTFLFRAGRHHGVNASQRGRTNSIFGRIGRRLHRAQAPSGPPGLTTSNNRYEASGATPLKQVAGLVKSCSKRRRKGGILSPS